MTDKETALALGQYINSLLQEIDALKGVIFEYRVEGPNGPQEIPLLEVKKKVSREEIFRRVCDAQRTGLLQAIGDETQASLLIRALSSHYLQQ